MQALEALRAYADGDPFDFEVVRQLPMELTDGLSPDIDSLKEIHI